MKKWLITPVLLGGIVASTSVWAQVRVGVWVAPPRPVYVVPPPLFIPPPPVYRVYPSYPYPVYAPPVYRAYPPPVVIVPGPPVYRHQGYGRGRHWRRW